MARVSNGRDVDLEFKLPETVQSIRDGYQKTFESAAVVSGLLAGVAAQLYSFFKDDESYSEQAQKNTVARDWIVACCYCALFFNIGAAISGFLLIDGLGELQYRAASSQDPESLALVSGHITGTMLTLLQRFSGGGFWGWLIFHWFLSFCFGAISLLFLLCAYVLFQERMALKIVAIILTVYIIIPALIFTISLVFSSREPRDSHHTSSATTKSSPAPETNTTQRYSMVSLYQTAPSTPDGSAYESTLTLLNSPSSPSNPNPRGRAPV